MYVCAGIAEWSLGNTKSDFRETRASFKEKSNRLQLIRFFLKENNYQVRNTLMISPVSPLNPYLFNYVFPFHIFFCNGLIFLIKSLFILFIYLVTQCSLQDLSSPAINQTLATKPSTNFLVV